MARPDARALKAARCLAALAGLVLVAAVARAQHAGPTQLRFADLEQARAALVADDDWMAATSPFQRAATLGPGGAADLDRFKAGLARAARECSQQEQQRWRAAAGAALPRLQQLALPLPPAVTIVCTDGTDAANAPYTRGQAIFLPHALAPSQYSDTELLAHEMVHVVTRADAALATRLYRELGFEPVEDLAWPPEWTPARIANPDAPHDRHAMRLDSPDGPRWLMPLLVAERTALRPGETFFSVLQVRLLAVEPGAAGQPTRPVRRNGQLLWWPVEGLRPYLQRLGGNTAYVFHPEETLADNLAFLASGRAVPNPALLERLRAALADRAGTLPNPK